MKRRLIFLFFVAGMVAWCTPGFAAVPQDVQAGAGGHDLDATGKEWGVWMDTSFVIIGGSDTTLRVGTENIYEHNSSGGNVSDKTLSAAFATDAAFAFITFSGTSKVFGTIGVDLGSTFKDITLTGGPTDTVDFFGTVKTETMKVATGTANFRSGTNDNAAAVTFTDDGTVGVDTNTIVTGALYTNWDEKGTLSLSSGSGWTGAVGKASTSAGLKAINVVGGSNIAGVSATITGAVYAHSFSLLTNKLNIDGALTIGPAGVIDTTIASDTVYGQIIKLSGDTSLPAALTVNVTVPSGAYIPLGTLFNIVQSAAGTGGGVITVTNVGLANPLYTFSADPMPAVHGQVTIKTTGLPMQVSPNPVVPVLIAIPLTPDLVNVLTPLNALTNPAAVVNAVAQLAPSDPALAAPLVVVQGARQFQNLWMSRLDMCQVSRPENENPNVPSGVSSGDEMQGAGDGLWANTFGYFGHQDAEGISTEYNSRTIGTLVAYDKPIGLNTRAGLGVGYAWSTIDGKTFDTDTDLNTYEATAYIGHERGSWFVHGSASFGWNEYSGSRHIVFPGVDRTANADYSGQDYTAFASTGYHISAQKFTITPLASLQYSRVNISGYTETDAGAINLKVESQHYDFLESGLGVKVERDFNYRDSTYVPEIHFKWLHELYNPTLENTAAFTVAGSPFFTTLGLKPADDTFNVGAGCTLFSRSCRAITWSLEAIYDYYGRNDGYSANQGTMRATVRF